MERVVAMLLAGGQGRRMDALCLARPKPALPFAGSHRVIDFTLSNCLHSQIRRMAALVDYRRLEMAGYLRRWQAADGTGSVDILMPRTGSYLGTADAVYQNLDYLDAARPTWCWYWPGTTSTGWTTATWWTSTGGRAPT